MDIEELKRRYPVGTKFYSATRRKTQYTVARHNFRKACSGVICVDIIERNEDGNYEGAVRNNDAGNTWAKIISIPDQVLVLEIY